MRGIFFLLTAACLQVSARGWGQNITFKGSAVPLSRVFNVIEKQTGYVVFYNVDLVEHATPVTIEASEQPLGEFLHEVLKDQQLDYLLSKTSIVIIRKKQLHPEPGVKDETEETSPVNIKGRVVDEKGEPLAGISVMVKETRQATATGMNGEFNLQNVDGSATLVLTGANIETKEVKVNGRKEIIVGTRAKINKLDELQVIAYGTTTQRFSVGSVNTVKGEDIEKSPVSNPILALQGRVPSVYINQNSGVPGGGMTVRIQGQNSLNAGNDPFYVIDGVPYISQMLPNLGDPLRTTGNQWGNPLAFINPSDIESISILKDADATAIYGARAANGAVLITTKKAKAGPMRIEANVDYGFSKVGKFKNMMNTRQYVAMRREAIANAGKTVGATDYDVNGAWDTTHTVSWQKELLGKSAKYLNASLNLSGGTMYAQYLVGATYHREYAAIPGSFPNQNATLHFNVSGLSPNQKLRVQLTGSYSAGLNQLPGTDVARIGLYAAPNAPNPLNPDGSLNWGPLWQGSYTFYNPLSILLKKFKQTSGNMVANFTLSYSVLPGLDLRASVGYNRLQVDQLTLNPMIANRPDYRPTSTRDASYCNNLSSAWTIEPQLTYRRQLGAGSLDVLLATNVQQNNSVSRQYYAAGFISDAVMENMQAAANVYAGGNMLVQQKYNGVFGRINYNLSKKYIADLTLRRDGSSKFGPENRFHNFWAIGAGWIFSEEPFSRSMFPWLSFGKLRGSYGVTGNDQIGDYQYVLLYNPWTPGQPYRNSPGLIPQGIANPYLQWEVNRKTALGLELGFLKDKLMLNVGYQVNRSSNLLKGQPLPRYAGSGSVTVNFPATVQNTDLAIVLTSKNVETRQFSWNTSFNISFQRNKLVAYPGLNQSSDSGWLFVGQSLNVIKLFRILGVDPQTGLYKFLDAKGQPSYRLDYGPDRNIVKDGFPAYFGGMTNSLRLGSVNFEFTFQLVKQMFNNADYELGIAPGQAMTNQPATLLDRWRKPGDVAKHQKVGSDYFFTETHGYAVQSMLAWSGSYFVKLRNVNASWSIPPSWLKYSKLKEMHLGFAVQNVLTITDFKGLDPETGDSFPPTRTFVFNVKISF